MIKLRHQQRSLWEDLFADEVAELWEPWMRVVEGENLTNNDYEIGRTPVATLGQPTLVRGGLRWHGRR